MKRYALLIGGMGVTVIGSYLYLTYRVPPGIETMGGESETVAWIGLASSIVGFSTAVINMVLVVFNRKSKD